MNVLIIHNQLWAHYKALLFSELHKLSPGFDIQIHVAQIAVSEKSRADMGDLDQEIYHYNYTLLFNDSLENVRLWPKVKALFKLFNNYKPDLLNITGYYDPAQVLLLFWAKLRGIKVVISNESNARDNEAGLLKNTIKRLILGLADGFICFGKSSAAFLQLFNVSVSKIVTQKAAIVDNQKLYDTHQTAIANRVARKAELNLPSHNFIFVGRLIEPKNLFRLLDCFNKICNSDWGLILLGEGEQKSDLQQFVIKNEIENITFLAGVNWYEVPNYLALADVFVLPSTSEPWGLVVNEAMVCGLPVLVSDCCGCVEDLVKNNENGFSFDPYNAEELTEKLRYFVQNPDQIKPMGEASRQSIAQFSAATVATEILTGFRRLGGS
jgi:glycosyltransferase involved in cell wall biosynthesis